MSGAARFEVLSPLACDGTDYAPGDVVEIPREQAQDLINVGVLAPAAPDVAPAPAAERLDLETDLPTLIANSHHALMDAIEAVRRDVAALAGAAPAYPAKDADPSPAPESGEGESATKAADPAPAPEAGAGEAATRHDRIVMAIADLTPGRDDHWTRAGKPEVAALRAATGLDDVTAAERDAAWATFQAHD